MIQTVVKRDGRIVGFNEQKIMAAIRKAMCNRSTSCSIFDGIGFDVKKAKTTLDVKRHLLRCGVWLPSLPSIFLGTGGNEDVVEQVKKRIKNKVSAESELISEQASSKTPVAVKENEEQEPIFSDHHNKPCRNCGVCEDLYPEARDKESVERIRGYGQYPEANDLVARGGSGSRENYYRRAKETGTAGTEKTKSQSYEDYLYATTQATKEEGQRLLRSRDKPGQGEISDCFAPQAYRRQTKTSGLYHAYPSSPGCRSNTPSYVWRSRKRVRRRPFLQRVVQLLDQ